MSFQIVKAETRVARMIQWFSGICTTITDFVVGSKIRSKFETIAVEMESMDFAWYQSLRKEIPTAIYQAFDFVKLPASAATGTVTFTASTPPATNINIGKGTRVATLQTGTQAEIIFQTTADAVLLAGESTITATVACIVSGVVGNVGANTITQIKQSINGITSVTNEAAMTGGAAVESEAARHTRFIEYISTLTRGTDSAIKAGAKSAKIYTDGVITEQVTSTSTVESTDPYGLVDCYIYNGIGNTSPELVAEAQKIIDGYESGGVRIAGYKAAGVIVSVIAAEEDPLDITATVVGLSDTDPAVLQATVEAALMDYTSSREVEQEWLRSEAIERAMAVAGVYNFLLDAPAADITPSTGHVVTALGTMTITVA